MPAMGKATIELPVWRVRDGQVTREKMVFAHEVPLSLVVGGREVTVLMATPGQETELAVGYALTMGWLRPEDEPPSVSYDPEQRRVELAVDLDPKLLSGVRAAGGGLLGPSEAPPLPLDHEMELAVVGALTQAMSNAQKLYRPSRGTHAAALFSASGELISLGEDVGRHNGLDKAVGAAWLAGRLHQAAALSLSGRCSLEMVLKAVRSRVGVTVSVSAPTVPAVRTAERLGLTLVNCYRPEEMTIYTHAARLTKQGRPLTTC